jgi:hypothetical protein
VGDEGLGRSGDKLYVHVMLYCDGNVLYPASLLTPSRAFYVYSPRHAGSVPLTLDDAHPLEYRGQC